MIRNHLVCEKTFHSATPHYDIISVDVQDPISLETLRFVAIYRPGDITFEQNNSFIDHLLEISSVSYSCIFVGDFNYHINFTSMQSNNASARSFIDFMNNLSLRQYVSAPTRGANILDLVLCAENCIFDVLVCESKISSDHSAVTFKTTFPAIESVSHPIFLYAKADFKAIETILQNSIWENILLPYNSIDQLYSNFAKYLSLVLHQHTPTLCKKPLYVTYPSYIRNLISAKQRLFQSLSSSRHELPQNVDSYQYICRELKRHLQQFEAYKQRRLLKSLHKTKFYSYLNSRSSIRSPEISSFRSSPSGPLLVKPLDQAEALAQQFLSVFIVDDGVLPFIPQCPVTMSLPVIFPQSVSSILRSLKPGCSLPPDKLPQIVFKKCHASLSIPLSFIFNLSLELGTVPAPWKESIIVPLAKKNNPVVASDFRPISLTSTSCKVMEKLLCQWLYDHFTLNGFIPEQQHGFVRGRSVESQLLDVQYEWLQAADECKFTDVIYYDFSKAFDKVSHSKLLHKLYSSGVPINLVKWIESFLVNRTFSVKVKDVQSGHYSVSSGVPQGSVLGPLLFLFYVSELPNFLERAQVKVRCFADDLKVYVVYKKEEYQQAHLNMQTSINYMLEWCNTWQLEIANHKCHALYLGTANPKHAYHIAAVPLDEVKSVRDLGIKIQNNLQFNEHLNLVYNSAIWKMHILLRIVHIRDPAIIVHCFKTWVLPKLEFSSSVWSPFKMKDIRKIERVQSSFTRIVYFKCFGVRCYTDLPNYRDRLRRLELVSLQERRIRKDLVLAFKIISGEVRLSRSKYFRPKPTNGRTKFYNFHIPFTKCSAFKNSFFIRAAVWLMKLPSDILKAQNSIQFQAALKKIDLVSFFQLPCVT